MARNPTLAVLACAAALPALPAQAQQTCLPRDSIVEVLDETYSEALIGRGLQNADSLLEVFTTEDGASWTIIQTFPDGLSCVMATGTNWLREPDAFEPAGMKG